jgi:hypothetical protein
MRRECFSAKQMPSSIRGDDDVNKVCTIRDALNLPCICANFELLDCVKDVGARSNAIVITA